MIKKKKHLILFFFISIILLYILFSFPIMRFLAEKSTYSYMKEQNVTVQKIKSKEIVKTYKINGYKIIIKFIDDPNYIYVYKYFPYNGFLGYELKLNIYNNNYEEYGSNKYQNKEKPKYIPNNYEK